MRVQLQVSHQKANVKEVTLTAETLIGRSAECNLKIASNQVSRQHCRIAVNGNQVLVQDLDSANGTFVDGERIPPKKNVPLKPGCSLAIGPVRFVVRYQPQTAAVVEDDDETETARSPSGILAVGGDEPDATPASGMAALGDSAEPTPEQAVEGIGVDTVAAAVDETVQFNFAEHEPDAFTQGLAELPRVDAAAETLIPGAGLPEDIEVEELEDEAEPDEPATGKRRSLFGLFGKKKRQPVKEQSHETAPLADIDAEDAEDAATEPDAEATVAFTLPAEEDVPPEIDEDDVTAFLNSPESGDDKKKASDEDLGDFLKQF